MKILRLQKTKHALFFLNDDKFKGLIEEGYRLVNRDGMGDPLKPIWCVRVLFRLSVIC